MTQPPHSKKWIVDRASLFKAEWTAAIKMPVARSVATSEVLSVFDSLSVDYMKSR